MDRAAPSSQLPSSVLSAASRLSSPYSDSVAGSDTDTPIESLLPSSALRPQEMPTTSQAETAAAMPVPLGTVASSPAVAVAFTPLRSHRLSSFLAFRSLYSPGRPFHAVARERGRRSAQHFIAVLSFAWLCSLRTATADARLRQRQLEEEEWNGEWNGEWTAQQGDDYVYECDGDDCDGTSGSENNNNDMWLHNDADELALTPDQIITFVSIGILSFMTLLCCVCYPEILVVTCGKLCCGAGGAKGAGARGAVEDAATPDCDYVGGEQRKVKKKQRKSKPKSGSRSSRTKSSRNIELV